MQIIVDLRSSGGDLASAPMRTRATSAGSPTAEPIAPEVDPMSNFFQNGTGTPFSCVYIYIYIYISMYYHAYISFQV
jgi:hypothetical protein